MAGIVVFINQAYGYKRPVDAVASSPVGPRFNHLEMVMYNKPQMGFYCYLLLLYSSAAYQSYQVTTEY